MKKIIDKIYVDTQQDTVLLKINHKMLSDIILPLVIFVKLCSSPLCSLYSYVLPQCDHSDAYYKKPVIK